MIQVAQASSSGVRPPLSWLIGLRAQARRLDLLPRAFCLTACSGAHRSPLRGRGLEYLESRPYLPGDEPRQMDWRLTARRFSPHVKVFAEERERPLWLVVDQGPSMRFGTQVAFKSAVAAQVAAILGWAAVESGDRVGGLVFDERRLFRQQPVPRERGLLALLARLSDTLGPAAGGQSLLLESIRHLANSVRPGGLIIMISDFMGLDDSLAAWAARLRLGNELIFVLIHDLLESEPPPAGYYPVFWEGRHWLVDLSHSATRLRYRACFEQRCALLATLARRSGAHWLRLATHEPVGPALAKGLGGHIPGRA